MHPYQKLILELINQRYPIGVSYREIGPLLDESHPQKIRHHVDQLVKRGFIRLDALTKTLYKSFSEEESPLVSIPIYGAANCGPATYFAEDYVQSHLRISKKFIDPTLLPRMRNIIGLEASGDSMNKATVGRDKLPINDGDYVLVDTMLKGVTLEGNYVVSIIDDAANIKKAARYGDEHIHLMSESTRSYPPILLHDADRYIIVGNVMQVIPKETYK